MSHPIRRKILSSIFDNGSISFTILSKDWSLATGTIYHHLKALNQLITQNSSNLYILNDKGVAVCEWFLQTNQGKTSVQKISSFTSITYKLFTIIENNSKLVLLLSLFGLFLGFYFSQDLEIVILGPFLLPKPDFIEIKQIFFFNITIIIGLFLLFSSIIYHINRKILGRPMVIIFCLSLLPVNLIVILVYILELLITVNISLPIWIFLSLICQFFYLILNSSALISFYGINIEKSVIIMLSNLYLLLIFALLLV